MPSSNQRGREKNFIYCTLLTYNTDQEHCDVKNYFIFYSFRHQIFRFAVKKRNNILEKWINS